MREGFKGKKHDSNERSGTRIASTVISKLKKKEKRIRIALYFPAIPKTRRQHQQKNVSVLHPANYRCEGRRRHSLIFKVSKKNLPYIHPFPGSPWSMCTTKTREKQTKKKKDMNTNDPRNSVSTGCLRITGKEDPEMTGKLSTRRDPEEAFQKDRVNNMPSVSECIQRTCLQLRDSEG